MLLFIALNEFISPEPESANPIPGVSFTQLYVVVPPEFSVVNTIVSDRSELHNIWLSISLTWPVGFTVIIIEKESPTHPSAEVGVTLYVAVAGAFEILFNIELVKKGDTEPEELPVIVPGGEITGLPQE